ncbi:MAG: alpha-isopropylmalate synthase regulatory domain-containing protein [Clostridia bacterium]
MRTIVSIKDETLKNCESDKNLNISFKEKLEIAKQLEHINVDIIETGMPEQSQGNFIAVKTIASTLKKSILCCPVKASVESIDKAWDAVKGAVHPRLHISLPTSVVNMEYQLHLKRNQVLSLTKDMITYAKSLCEDIEFTAEDATRSDSEFLINIVNTAAESGASVIGLEDSVGQMLPEEIYLFVSHLKKSIPALNEVQLSFHAKNDFGMAVANTVSAIKAGADQISCAVNGTSNDASLEDTVMALQMRGDTLDASCNILTTEVMRASKLLSAMTDIKHVKAPARSTEVTAAENTDNTLIDRDIDIYSFRAHIEQLGYTLTEKDVEKIYDLFKELTEKKQQIYDRDVEALIGREAIQVPRVYQLDSFVINSGNKITSTAVVRLMHNEQALERVATGDGPIDASFHVIEKILGRDIELFDYNLKSVTEGKDALGAALVKLRFNGNIYTGRGLSTDIIESSILAYINAVNKMLFEEGIQ